MRPSPDDEDCRYRAYVIVFEAETPAGQAFDIALLLLIVMSVTTTMLETVHHLLMQYRPFFEASEDVFTAIFSAEYMLRIFIARPSAAAYVFSFFGIVDLCAVLPSLIEDLLPRGTGTSSLRIVRVLRLLRVFRVLHVTGLTEEADALRSAFWASRRKIVVFLLAIITTVTVLGTVVYVLEDNEHSGFTSTVSTVVFVKILLSSSSCISKSKFVTSPSACVCTTSLV